MALQPDVIVAVTTPVAATLGDRLCRGAIGEHQRAILTHARRRNRSIAITQGARAFGREPQRMA
jgi:hypothetical protein